MILNIFYSILSIVYLSKKSPNLFNKLNNNIKNTKRSNEIKNKDGTYQALTILFGLFGFHNMYEKNISLGVVKFLIICNYLFYIFYFMKTYEKEHEEEFDTFIKNKSIEDADKKYIKKDLIEYTVKNRDTNEYKYHFSHNIDNYIKNKHKNFKYYKMISEVFFFINTLHWVIDILKIV